MAVDATDTQAIPGLLLEAFVAAGFGVRVEVMKWIRNATVLAVALVLALPSAASAADDDGDGVDDGMEDALADRFFPLVWFDNGEDCTAPAETWNPGTVLARVRPHPENPANIAITYVVLYRRDCGDLFGIGSHGGDVEAVSLTLAPNPACGDGYGAFSLKTVAHQGTGFEVTEVAYLGNACDWGRHAGGRGAIYSSENKHGNYINDGTCDDALGGGENCGADFTTDFGVFNVGEDWFRRVDELSGHQFPGEYAWSPVPFTGSSGESGDAGLVRDKFLNDGLLAPAF